MLGLSAAALVAALALYYGRWRTLEATLDPSGAETSAADRRTVVSPRNPTPLAPRPSRTGSTAASGTRIARAAWGSRPGELGRRGGDESSLEGPAALIADGEDQLVLDAVNARLVRYRRGAQVAELAIGDRVQDAAIAPGRRTVTLDRLGDRAIAIFGADGTLENEVPIAGRGLEDPGLASGVFADEEGYWVEREHGSLVKIAGSDGKADAERRELPGRPTRDGALVVNAAVTDRRTGSLRVTAFDRRSLEVRWSAAIDLGAQILQLVMLDSDRAGHVYVAADVAQEGPPPEFRLTGAAIRAVRLDGAGRETGRLDLPPLGEGFETTRPLAIEDDGTLIMLRPTEAGVDVIRFSF